MCLRGAEGTDSPSGVEIINHGGANNILLVGGGGYATIQAAINAASAGDTILIASGTYNENIVVNQSVTLIGSANTVIQGGFLANNGLASGASVADFLKTAPSYTRAAGNGVTITADNATLQNITVTRLPVPRSSSATGSTTR